MKFDLGVKASHATLTNSNLGRLVLGFQRILEDYSCYGITEDVMVQAVKIPSLDRRLTVKGIRQSTALTLKLPPTMTLVVFLISPQGSGSMVVSYKLVRCQVAGEQGEPRPFHPDKTVAFTMSETRSPSSIGNPNFSGTGSHRQSGENQSGDCFHCLSQYC